MMALSSSPLSPSPYLAVWEDDDDDSQHRRPHWHADPHPFARPDKGPVPLTPPMQNNKQSTPAAYSNGMNTKAPSPPHRNQIVSPTATAPADNTAAPRADGQQHVHRKSLRVKQFAAIFSSTSNTAASAQTQTNSQAGAHRRGSSNSQAAGGILSKVALFSNSNSTGGSTPVANKPKRNSAVNRQQQNQNKQSPTTTPTATATATATATPIPPAPSHPPPAPPQKRNSIVAKVSPAVAAVLEKTMGSATNHQLNDSKKGEQKKKEEENLTLGVKKPGLTTSASSSALAALAKSAAAAAASLSTAAASSSTASTSAASSSSTNLAPPTDSLSVGMSSMQSSDAVNLKSSWNQNSPTRPMSHSAPPSPVPAARSLPALTASPAKPATSAASNATAGVPHAPPTVNTSASYMSAESGRSPPPLPARSPPPLPPRSKANSPRGSPAPSPLTPSRALSPGSPAALDLDLLSATAAAGKRKPPPLPLSASVDQAQIPTTRAASSSCPASPRGAVEFEDDEDADGIWYSEDEESEGKDSADANEPAETKKQDGANPSSVGRRKRYEQLRQHRRRERANALNKQDRSNTLNVPSSVPTSTRSLSASPSMDFDQSASLVSSPPEKESPANAQKSLDSKERREQEREAEKEQDVAAEAKMTAEERTKRDEHRAKISEEILSTERSYLSNLKCIVMFYVYPLRDQASHLGLAMENVSELVINVETLANFHQTLLADLEANANSMAKSFLRFADFMKMYTTYLSHYERFLRALKDLQKHKKWQEFLSNVKRQLSSGSNNQGMDLTSYMIMPVQRVPRYLLLLKELRKYTSPSHHEYDTLLQLLPKLDAVASALNEGKRDVENMNKLLDIQARIIGDLDLIAPHRRLLKEGTLPAFNEAPTPTGSSSTSASKRRFSVFSTLRAQKQVIFLFNDMVVWTSTDLKLNGSVEFAWASLDSSVDEQRGFGSNRSYFFSIKSSAACLTAQCSSAAELNDWTSEIRVLIQSEIERREARMQARVRSGLTRNQIRMNKTLRAQEQAHHSRPPSISLHGSTDLSALALNRRGSQPNIVSALFAPLRSGSVETGIGAVSVSASDAIAANEAVKAGQSMSGRDTPSAQNRGASGSLGGQAHDPHQHRVAMHSMIREKLGTINSAERKNHSTDSTHGSEDSEASELNKENAAPLTTAEKLAKYKSLPAALPDGHHRDAAPAGGSPSSNPPASSSLSNAPKLRPAPIAPANPSPTASPVAAAASAVPAMHPPMASPINVFRK